MNRKPKKAQVILAIGLLWVGSLRAQTAINSSGGDASNSSGVVSFSFGQPFNAVKSTNDGSVEVGVQHAYIITGVSSIEDQEMNVTLKAYPNPTKDYLTLSINEGYEENLRFNLLNIQGQLIHQRKIEGKKSQINMIGLSPGTYFFNVFNSKNRKIKTFKIIKK